MGIFDKNKTRTSNYKGTNTDKVKKFIHTPVTVNHFGTTARIKENGKVILSREVKDSDPPEYDEIEVSASLIYKVVNLLEITRKVKWVSKEELNAKT